MRRERRKNWILKCFWCIWRVFLGRRALMKWIWFYGNVAFGLMKSIKFSLSIDVINCFSKWFEKVFPIVCIFFKQVICMDQFCTILFSRIAAVYLKISLHKNLTQGGDKNWKILRWSLLWFSQKPRDWGAT